MAQMLWKILNLWPNLPWRHTQKDILTLKAANMYYPDNRPAKRATYRPTEVGHLRRLGNSKMYLRGYHISK